MSEQQGKAATAACCEALLPVWDEWFWDVPEALAQRESTLPRAWLTYRAIQLWDSGKDLWWKSTSDRPWDAEAVIVPASVNELEMTEGGQRVECVDLSPAASSIHACMPPVDPIGHYQDADGNRIIVWRSDAVDNTMPPDVRFFFVSEGHPSNPVAAFHLPTSGPDDPISVAKRYLCEDQTVIPEAGLAAMESEL